MQDPTPQYEFVESIYGRGGRPFPFVANELLMQLRSGEYYSIQCGSPMEVFRG